MLDPKEKAKLQELSASEKTTAIREQVARCHGAINDGTLDRDTANDALDHISALTEDAKSDSFAKFTGQGAPSAVATPNPPVQSSAATEAPAAV